MFIYLFNLLQDVEELMSLPPEKMLLRWMNFHLKRAGYKKTITNFSSDVRVSNIPLKITGTVLFMCLLIELMSLPWGKYIAFVLRS